MEINGLFCHDKLTKSIKPKLAFDGNKDFSLWRSEIKTKLIELLGLDVIAENACESNLRIVEEEEKDGYKQIRFEFESEKGAVVPCYLLIPDTKKEKYSVAIVLQGHNEQGFYSSIPSLTIDIEESLVEKIEKEELHKALKRLTKEEREFIKALFFDGYSERDYAKKTGVYKERLFDLNQLCITVMYSEEEIRKAKAKLSC